MVEVECGVVIDYAHHCAIAKSLLDREVPYEHDLLIVLEFESMLG